MFELMYLIALPSLFLLVLCGLYGLTTWFSMQKEEGGRQRAAARPPAGAGQQGGREAGYCCKAGGVS